MAIEEQLIELIGEFEPDKWYIVRPTMLCRSATLKELGEIFRRNKPDGAGGILILSDYLNIQGVEAYTIRSTLRTFRINLDILHALYRQIKWRPWVRLRGALQKLGIIV